MDQTKRKEILNTMIEISKQVDKHLDTNMQERGNVTYCKDFEFKGSGLGAENVYIVETPIQKQKQTGDKTRGNNTIYEIYDEDARLMATVSEDGKLHFSPEYLEQLKEINPKYYEQLNLENIDFDLPEELQENDMVITKEELQEHENKINEKQEKQRDNRQKGEIDKQEENDNYDQKQESEEDKKDKVAQTLGVEVSEVKSICTINPREKITDKDSLVDIMPEAGEYSEISIACTSQNGKSNSQFTILGISEGEQTKNTKVTPLTSIEPIEGTSTGKDVISVNEDGTQVSEKEVQGLFIINSGNRTDGISVSVGDYGMMDVDYVSNVMDKDLRRATPIKTEGPENVRMPSARVRENAGDSIEEMEKEGRIFRAKEEKGIDPQSLDGIDIDKADGREMTLGELKEYIKEQALEKGDMSKEETREFIKSEIAESGLELSEAEVEHTTDEIEMQVLDESRFPTR